MNITEKESIIHHKMMSEKIEKNYLTIALDVLFGKKEKINRAYVSKYNSKRQKQVAFLMITIGIVLQ